MDAVNQCIHFSSANMSLHPLAICSVSVWSKDFCMEKLFSFCCSFACLNKGPEFPHLISPQKESAPPHYTQTSSGKITAKQQKYAFFSHKKEFSLTLCCWKTHLVCGKKTGSLASESLISWSLHKAEKQIGSVFVKYILQQSNRSGWCVHQMAYRTTLSNSDISWQSASQAWSHSHSHMFRASTVGSKR